ncbi:hypothetical protein PENTCL1PPCAC_13263, partial [Pristionchus entomophagus]
KKNLIQIVKSELVSIAFLVVVATGTVRATLNAACTEQKDSIVVQIRFVMLLEVDNITVQRGGIHL